MRRLRMSPYALALCAATAAFAQPGFEGTWALQVGRSSALPPGMEQRMTIAREGDGLRVKTAIVTDFADREQDDLYVFDGAPHDAQSPGAGSGKRIATRQAERAFSAVDTLQGPNGETTISRTWELADDGGELTIDLTVASAFSGRTESHRVFVRGERAPAAPPAASRLFPVDLSVPVPPSPFRQAGKTQLVYELSLRSFRAGEVEWRRLEVLDETGRKLASFEGDDLAGLLGRPGTGPALVAPRRIGAGMTAIAYLWLSVDGAPPRTLRHRAAFSLPSAASGSERVVELPEVAVGAPAIVIGPPARGPGWVVRWISNTSFHRRGAFPVDGRAGIAQRFAIDWNRYDEKGVEQSGDESENATYSVFGQEVVAVADATVAKTIDGVPQNSPPNIAPGVGLDPEKALGNCVVLQLSNGLYATYAHMQPGSIAVKVGDPVHRGQRLGKVGNSGNATGPHLHFHLATGPGLEGEGMPYVLDGFEKLGEENVAGDKPTWNPAAATPAAVRGELPSEHAVVAFP